MSGNDEDISDDRVADELKNLIQTTDLSMSSECCIFRVPDILRRHNPRAFEPDAFSIGPFHHHKPHLKATQRIKLKYLQSLVSVAPGMTPDAMLRRLTQGIRENLQSFRDCYEGPIGISMNEFLKVLVLDGCFLVELLRKDVHENLREEDDPIFAMACMTQFLFHDLIMLENQIPWSLLDRVFDMTVDHTRDEVSLVELAMSFFLKRSFTAMSINAMSPSWRNQLRHSKHILDFLRNTFILRFPIERDSRSLNIHWQAIPTVTTMKEAGIRFKRLDSSESILGIYFTKGVLHIPPLYVDETTEALFRNLISYEQCLPYCEGVVTSYAILMDKLIDTTADMEVLCRNGVVNSLLSIEDATLLFNQLYNDSYVRDYHYISMEESIMKYCCLCWPRYRRALMHDYHVYLKHPWAIISVAAAVALLVLTFLQTIFTIKK